MKFCFFYRETKQQLDYDDLKEIYLIMSTASSIR